MPETTLGVVTSANFIPELWGPEIRHFLRSRLIMANLVKRVSFVGKAGDTLHIPDLSELTVTAKATGVDVTFQNPTETKFDLSIDQHFESSFKVEDIAQAQAFADLRAEYTRSSGYAMAKKIDATLHALHTTASFVRKVGSDGSTAWSGAANANAGNGADLTEAGIRNAIEILDLANVPENDRYLVINPRQKNVMLGIGRFTEYDKTGVAGTIYNGMFGEVFGVRVYVTTATATLVADDTTTNYDVNYLFQKDAFILAMQKEVRTQGQYWLPSLSDVVVVDAIWGKGVYRLNHAVALITPQA
jgi:N4-gp56 family major capsid protein